MITNKMKIVQLKMREARFWPKMKFEPIFFQVLWQFFNPKGPLLRQRRTGAAGGRGVWGEFRPPYKFWAKSVRIFSNAHRQLGNVFVGSPSARARQPILSANWNFLSLPRYCGAGQKRASRIFIFNF
ncbi:MAG: hypothetical protein UT36_C0014G0001 [Candidatus Peregrinibacteria bacterium GW2011_GWF2_39_17]|nr:MAG: hypothetical protein UT36_C0014G0001 [Candidatus Peregrinibacteria bacterium GW2011_GWF2_39_17]